MRARRNRVWILTALFAVAAAAWMAAGWSIASAGSVVTVTDPSIELQLLDAGSVASTAGSCNVCVTPPGPCTKENCFLINPSCRCRQCAGELKCTH